MKPLTQFAAVIFDLDGTLVDSLPLWRYLCRDWLCGQGFKPADDLESELTALTLEQAAAQVRQAYGLALSPAEIIAGWQQLVIERYRQQVELKPGARELLTALAAQGVQLALATSCFPAACEAVLRRHDLWRLFGAVVYSDEVGGNKTGPAIWLACAERLGVPPTDCAVCEDMREAGPGVRAAGMSLVAVHDPANAGWAEFSREADAAVLSLSELL